MLRRLAAAPILALLAAAALSAPADAQRVTLRGRVVDAATGAPVAAAQIAVAGRREREVANTAGEFAIQLPAGPHVIQAGALGYGEAETPVTVARDAGVVTIALTQDPVLLEAIEVVSDRFETRRKAVAVSTRVLRRTELALTSAPDMAQFIGRYVHGGGPANCAQVMLHQGRAGISCMRSQRAMGPSARAQVWIDETPMIGGLEVLELYDPDEFERVEIYAHGGQVRLYTTHFMERAARLGYRPMPIFI
jgi:hypothetical protein